MLVSLSQQFTHSSAIWDSFCQDCYIWQTQQMRRKQHWKRSLPPRELAGVEQWGWGPGAVPCPCQIMDQHCCSPKPIGPPIHQALGVKLWRLQEQASSTCMFTMHVEDSSLSLCHCWLGCPQSSLPHPEIFLKTKSLLQSDVDWAFAVQPHNRGFSWYSVVTSGCVGYLSSEILFQMWAENW